MYPWPLGKEFTAYVKGLVIPNKNIQSHITESTSLHEMNIYMLQHVHSTVQYSTDNIPLSNNKCACIIHPSWPTNHCKTKKRIIWWMPTQMKAQIYCFLDLLAPVSPATDMLPGAPLFLNRNWSCVGSSCWRQAVENICPKITCGECHRHQGLPVSMAPAQQMV